MKMAKASKKDFELMLEFYRAMEDIFDKNIKIGTFDENDEESEGDPIDDDYDAEKELHSVIQQWWEFHSSSWNRVVHGCEMLIENATDPNLTYLEFKPAILKAEEVCKLLTAGKIDEAKTLAAEVVAMSST